MAFPPGRNQMLPPPPPGLPGVDEMEGLGAGLGSLFGGGYVPEGEEVPLSSSPPLAGQPAQPPAEMGGGAEDPPLDLIGDIPPPPMPAMPPVGGPMQGAPSPAYGGAPPQGMPPMGMPQGAPPLGMAGGTGAGTLPASPLGGPGMDPARMGEILRQLAASRGPQQ